MNNKKKKISAFFMIGITGCLAVFLAIQTYVVTSRIQTFTADLYIQLCEQIISARADQIANWNEIYLNDLRIFSDNAVVKSGDEEAVKEWLDENRNLTNKTFGNTFFCGEDGNTFQLGNENSTQVSDRPYYKMIMQNGADTYIGEPLLSRALGRYVYMIARAAKDSRNGTFGFFCASVFPEELASVTNSIVVGKGGRAFILASNGTVIAHWDNDVIMNANYLTSQSENTQGLRAVAANMTSGLRGYDYYQAADGKKLVVYTPVPGTSWSLGLEVPVSQIKEASWSIIVIIMLLGFAVFALIMLFSLFFLRRIVKPLRIVEQTISGIAQGDADLTRRVNVHREDEIGQLVDGFNMFVGKLHQIISSVKNSKQKLANAESGLKQSVDNTGCSITEILCNIESCSNLVENQAAGVEETAGAVTEIAQNIVSLEKMIQTQAAGVTQASAAVEEMIGNINSVDNSVVKMAAEFNDLEKDARDGIEKQNSVNETVRMIANQSEMLQEANAAIAGIAQQTNMLAMNAAIEAAHAGDAGKGFSVVADEIRKLSETSSEQSRTIGDELNKIIAALESVVLSSQDSEETFNSLSSRIQQTDIVVRQIREAMSEQQAGSKQILEALRSMNDSTVEVRTASTEMSAGNKAILDEVRLLQESTTVIRDSMREMTEGAKTINETGAQLHAISREVTDSIQQIGEEIDLFKV